MDERWTAATCGRGQKRSHAVSEKGHALTLTWSSSAPTDTSASAPNVESSSLTEAASSSEASRRSSPSTLDAASSAATLESPTVSTFKLLSFSMNALRNLSLASIAPQLLTLAWEGSALKRRACSQTVVHLKVHVEADAASSGCRSAVAYLTSEEPFEGVLELRLREGIAVTGCWPRWPDEMSERSAVWRVEPYTRRFGNRVLYSFGVRLDLEGGVELSAAVDRWLAEGGIVELEARRKGGLRAVVGPLARSYRVLSSKGILRAVEAAPFTYIVLEGDCVAVRLHTEEQGVLAGHLEYQPSFEELPFELELKGFTVASVESVLLARLEDLHV